MTFTLCSFGFTVQAAPSSGNTPEDRGPREATNGRDPRSTPFCREGQTETFYEQPVDNATAGMRPVVRTCHHGAFVALAEAPIHKCREGEEQLFSEANDSYNGDVTYRSICRQGRFIRIN